ncbi:MAG TPA: GNAT family N-acetyltransferase [Gaiellaceae bacterium]|nr:GNAT family N-acetyltransferase [Gaiellaceae bacterium]
MNAEEGEVALRPLDSSRFEEFWSLFQASLPASAEETAALVGLTEERFRQLPHEVGELLQVELGADVVGFVWLEVRARELHLHALLVRPGFRGQGLGGRALAALVARYDDDVDAVELGVVPGNTAARRLYERAGFTYVGEREGFLIMRRILE